MTRAARRVLCSTRLRGPIAVAAIGASIAVDRSLAAAQDEAPGSTAGAQVSNELRAEYLFRSGERKFDAGKYAEACADFSESLRLGPKLGTLLNLALCHETVGKVATAWSEWSHAAAWAIQNGQKDRHDFAQQHVTSLQTKLPRVLLQLPSGQAIATVEIDGEPVPDARWYLPVFLDPGEHSVSLTAPGKQRSTVRFRVVSSPTEQLVTVPSLADEVKPTVAPVPVVTMQVVDPDYTRRALGYVSLAAGGGSLFMGLTFGVLALHCRNEAANKCIGERCTPEGLASYEEAQWKATVSTVTTVVGLAAIGVGTWLVLSSRAPQTVPRVGARARPEGGLDLGLGGSF